MGKTKNKSDQTAPANPADKKQSVTTVETRKVKIPLDRDELRDVANGMASAQLEIERLKDGASRAAKNYKNLITTQEELLAEYARKFRHGGTLEDAECSVTRDFEAGTIRVVRAETGETVEERAMTPEELQELPLGDPVDSDDAEDADAVDDTATPNISDLYVAVKLLRENASETFTAWSLKIAFEIEDKPLSYGTAVKLFEELEMRGFLRENGSVNIEAVDEFLNENENQEENDE